MFREESEFCILNWLLKFLPGSSFLSYPSTANMTAEMASNNESFAVFDPSTIESANTDSGRMTESYFPRSHRSSFSSTASSVAAEPGTMRLRPEPPTLRPVQPTRAATTADPTTPSTMQKAVAVDALSRNFPKPTQEHSVEEMLARPPQKWSLGAYVKSARDARAPVADNKEQQARAFTDAKKELLAAKEAMKQMAVAGRQ